MHSKFLRFFNSIDEVKLVPHFPVMHFQSGIFHSVFSVLHFPVVHFQFCIFRSRIFRSCIFLPWKLVPHYPVVSVALWSKWSLIGPSFSGPAFSVDPYRTSMAAILDSPRETLTVKRTQPNQAWIIPETVEKAGSQLATKRQAEPLGRCVWGDGGVPKTERLKVHVCYSEQINKASMSNSETGQRQSGAYIDWRPRDYGTLARILRKPILLIIDRAIRRNWVMLYWLVDKYRMTQ